MPHPLARRAGPLRDRPSFRPLSVDPQSQTGWSSAYLAGADHHRRGFSIRP